jgi:hypothetical protein
MGLTSHLYKPCQGSGEGDIVDKIRKERDIGNEARV